MVAGYPSPRGYLGICPNKISCLAANGRREYLFPLDLSSKYFLGKDLQGVAREAAGKRWFSVFAESGFLRRCSGQATGARCLKYAPGRGNSLQSEVKNLRFGMRVLQEFGARAA